jgi:hypothetical protein
VQFVKEVEQTTYTLSSQLLNAISLQSAYKIHDLEEKSQTYASESRDSVGETLESLKSEVRQQRQTLDSVRWAQYNQNHELGPQLPGEEKWSIYFITTLTCLSGSQTRGDMWADLQARGIAKQGGTISPPTLPKGVSWKDYNKMKTTADSMLQEMAYEDEKAMYPVAVKVMQTSIYALIKPKDTNTFVVDCHGSTVLRADVCVSQSNDPGLFAHLAYFPVEIKPHKKQPIPVKLAQPKSFSQILDYLIQLKAIQPYRSEFVGILTDFHETELITYSVSGDTVSVRTYKAASFTDAVLHADNLSRRQLKSIPNIYPQAFNGPFVISNVSKKHFLISYPLAKAPLPPLSASHPLPSMSPLPSVSHPPPSASRPKPKTRSTSKKIDEKAKEEAEESIGEWLRPMLHTESKRYMIKWAHAPGANVEAEVQNLKKVISLNCTNLPQLVWMDPSLHRGFGIVPVGRPIGPGELPGTCRNIVTGLLNGLKYIHDAGLVHRDIRLGNLVLIPSSAKPVKKVDEGASADVGGDQVVIVDFETAVAVGEHVDYEGGYICWPHRLLENGETRYVPEPSDDLHACILVVLHLLFPSRFGIFRASNISHMSSTEEKTNLLRLWTSLTLSKHWATFVTAAQQKDYNTLNDMADLFCSV